MIKQYSIKSACIAAFLAAMVASPLQASDVQYSFVEGRYILDAEIENVDGDGFHVGGQYLLQNDIYAFGSFETVDLDFNNDVDIFELGAGFIYPANAQWDANFEFSILKADVNNDDDTGFALAGGVRGMATPEIEARAKLTYADVNDSDTYITIAGDYFIRPNLAVGAEVDLAGDYETLSVGVRYFFR